MLKSVGVIGLAVLAYSFAEGEDFPAHVAGGVFPVTPLAAAQPIDSNPTGVQPSPVAASIWDNVYSEEQAKRGATAYASACARCHGANGNGAGEPDMPTSPSVARAAFISRWNGRTVAQLLAMVRLTMPQDNPGALSEQEFVDIVAHMLALSGAPAGPNELPADTAALGEITIVLRSPAN